MARGAEWGLTAVAAAGLVSFAAVTLAIIFDLRIILFASGSMTPTFQTGDAALVHTVPADRINVGDVVTVVPEGRSLPVTHRVVEVDRDAGDPRAAVLRLKGDANTEPDPWTYHVSDVARVVSPLPGVGAVLDMLRQRWVMPGAVVGVAAIVTAVWWPREPVAR